MSSIVTITFSPCIDKSASIPFLIPDKKLQCSKVKLEPGGGGINVARAIKKIGGNATCILLSGGYTGKFLNHLLEKESIHTIIIETINETRENFIIKDEHTDNQYRLGMPAGKLSGNEWKQCLNALNEIKDVDFIVVSGSLPPGVPLGIFEQLTKNAERKNAKLIVDISGNALKEAVIQGVYLIKPNLAELSALVGLSSIHIDQVEGIAKNVIQQYKCEIIVVSLGKEGAMLVTRDEIYRVSPPKVKVKSTVGAGDSMVAGIVYSLTKGSNLKQALQYGVACGTAATMNPGTGLCHKEDADGLYFLLSE
ncbi:1-phosphofructokinase family hexose kinase [Asinibacterium sp. OR53]|uniref:1-phosphofructokinase family hexose kinase n=1 Tax=Asinibacterium sp. OR53 TaxID=925409 RepID=UPI00047A734F|nr:1-phosphofructokinase family hexose kinase [Asinibacterium sp. OR53]